MTNTIKGTSPYPPAPPRPGPLPGFSSLEPPASNKTLLFFTSNFAIDFGMFFLHFNLAFGRFF